MIGSIHVLRLTALTFALTPALWGDLLVLKNGKLYNGSFVSGTRSLVRFDTGRRVIRSFRTADVERIVFGPLASTSAAGPQSSMPAATPRQTPAATARRAPQAPTAEARGTQAPVQQNPAATELPRGTARPLPVPVTPPAVSTPLDDSGSIDSAYTALGAATGVLGLPATTSQPTQDGKAAVRTFANGVIYYTPQFGAHAVYGPMRAAWTQSEGGGSRLGYPISDMQESNGGFSRSQSFERGSITWTQTDGAKIQYNDGRR